MFSLFLSGLSEAPVWWDSSNAGKQVEDLDSYNSSTEKFNLKCEAFKQKAERDCSNAIRIVPTLLSCYQLSIAGVPVIHPTPQLEAVPCTQITTICIWSG